MSSPGEIVRGFLLEPRARSNFDPFFSLCHSTAIGFLRYCHSRGYTLPLHRADREAAYSDLATTLLGELFRSEPGRPFAPIFDYFDRHDVTDYQSVNDAELHRHFKTLICGFVKRQLFRLRKVENSQAEILKRRIKDILRSPQYIKLEADYEEPVKVAWRKSAQNLRENAPPAPSELLREVVERAYVESLSRSEWCENIFKALDAEEDYQKAVGLNELLAIIVSVNAEALQELLPRPDEPPTPETEAMRSFLDDLIEQTIGWAKKNVIDDFALQGRIEVPQARAYCRALENYLLDLCHSGETDSMPQYFREVMPPEERDCYLTRHKYMFERVISESIKYFTSRLKEQTT